MLNPHNRLVDKVNSYPTNPADYTNHDLDMLLATQSELEITQTKIAEALNNVDNQGSKVTQEILEADDKLQRIKRIVQGAINNIFGGNLFEVNTIKRNREEDDYDTTRNRKIENRNIQRREIRDIQRNEFSLHLETLLQDVKLDIRVQNSMTIDDLKQEVLKELIQREYAVTDINQFRIISAGNEVIGGNVSDHPNLRQHQKLAYIVLIN